MKSVDWAILAIWVAILATIAVIVVQIWQLITSSPQVSAAMISGAALLFGGILTHYFTQIREQQNEQRQALRQNYMEVLSRIDKLVRGDGVEHDAFSNVHLQTWVVGSSDIVAKSKEVLIAARGDSGTDLRGALEALVRAMRNEVGLSESVQSDLTDVYLQRPATGIPTPAKKP